jgi:Glyoxalase-like domain
VGIESTIGERSMRVAWASVLDHLVFAAPDLAVAVAHFIELTGVTPVRGGRHLGVGTANYLVGFGGVHREGYLEIIGPDPDQADVDRSRPFGIDQLSRARLVTWAIHPGELNACTAAARAQGYDPGPARELSRVAPDGELLRWRLTEANLGEPGGVVPFLIDWGDTTPPPRRDLPEVALLEFGATHPRPEPVRAALEALSCGLSAQLRVRAGNRIGLTAVLDGQHGPVVLS